MMGGDGTNIEGEVGELHLSAICEAMNQMMGSSSTSLSSMLNMKIDITPPTANLIDLNDDFALEDYSDFLKGNFIKIAFKMTVGDLVNSEIMQLYPVELCKTLCNRFGMGGDSSQSETSTTSEPEQSAAATVQDIPPASNMPSMEQQPMAGNMNYGMPMQDASQAMMQGMPMQNMQQGMMQQGMMQQGMMMQGMPMQQGMPQGMMMTGMPMQNINVQQAQFQTFSPDIVAVNQKENINLIMDVPLQVTVELGRTSKSIQDILEFSPGTIIELNKIAGEPVDVLVNNKYVAKGEVVVIEESFGVRVTEIIR